MYVRLAFAVAAHLEPEILIVDEVLAVGDAQFQKKCLGKMQDVSRGGGRTVLFVSHNMSAVLRLCKHAILMQNGTVVYNGSAAAATKEYLAGQFKTGAERIWDDGKGPGDDVGRLAAVRVLNQDGAVSELLDIGEEIQIEVEYDSNQMALRPTISIHIVNEEGICLFVSNDFANAEWWQAPRRRGRVRGRCTIPAHFLAEGRFSVLAAICTYNPDIAHCIEHEAVSFQVADSSDGGTVRGEFGGNWPGVVRPRLNWAVDYV
jgi:lipopolysaccharide transport system ATP-binding protein